MLALIAALGVALMWLLEKRWGFYHYAYAASLKKFDKSWSPQMLRDRCEEVIANFHGEHQKAVRWITAEQEEEWIQWHIDRNTKSQ